MGEWAGTAAALGQALIPYYTGVIIDYASIDPNADAFQWTCVKLIAVTLGCAVFTGVRGGLFTVGGATNPLHVAPWATSADALLLAGEGRDNPAWSVVALLQFRAETL